MELRGRYYEFSLEMTSEDIARVQSKADTLGWADALGLHFFQSGSGIVAVVSDTYRLSENVVAESIVKTCIEQAGAVYNPPWKVMWVDGARADVYMRGVAA